MTLSTRSMRSAALAASALMLAACSNSGRAPDKHTMAPTTTNAEVLGRTTLAMPITVPGTATVIVPFAIETEKDWFQTRDPYEAGGYGNGYRPVGSLSNSLGLTTSLSEGSYATVRGQYQSGGVRWHNAIIRNLHSGEQWPILDKRGVISSWAICGHPARQAADEFRTKALVFLATIDDTNHDGVLNDLDARVAIVTGPDGRDPRIVTPPNAQVWSVGYDAENNKLYFLVVADTTGDGKFDHNDTPVPYVCDITPGSMATPVVSQDMISRVRALLK